MSTTQHDVFRPYTEPARTFYDVLQKEAAKRPGLLPGEWQANERRAVWYAARDYAQQHGLRVLTLHEITQAETLAAGHIDYAAKWAYAVCELLSRARRRHE